MTQKQFFGLVILLLIGGLVYINWATLKKAVAGKGDAAGNGSNAGGGTPSTGTATTPGSTPYVPTLPAGNVSSTSATSKGLNMSLLLKSGVRGNEVMALQTLLNRFSTINQLKVDGIFGPATEAKLAQYSQLRQVTLQKAAELFYQHYKFYYTF